MLGGGTSDALSIESIDGGPSLSHPQLQEPLEEELPHGHPVNDDLTSPSFLFFYFIIILLFYFLFTYLSLYFKY